MGGGHETVSGLINRKNQTPVAGWVEIACMQVGLVVRLSIIRLVVRSTPGEIYCSTANESTTRYYTVNSMHVRAPRADCCYRSCAVLPRCAGRRCRVGNAVNCAACASGAGADRCWWSDCGADAS